MRLNGENHLEGGTLAFSRGDMDFAMQLINDGGTDAEPQSGALTETIALVKALKDVFLLDNAYSGRRTLQLFGKLFIGSLFIYEYNFYPIFHLYSFEVILLRSACTLFISRYPSV